MEITIQERDKWLMLEYDIATPAGTLLAKSQSSLLKQKFEISSPNGVAARIEENSSFLHSRYRFVLQDGRTYTFEREKFWTPLYKCVGNGETYSLEQHSQSKLSVRRDGLAVATIARPFSFLKGVEYKLSTEENADWLLIVCMVLATRAFDRAAETAVLITTTSAATT